MVLPKSMVISKKVYFFFFFFIQTVNSFLLQKKFISFVVVKQPLICVFFSFCNILIGFMLQMKKETQLLYLQVIDPLLRSMHY